MTPRDVSPSTKLSITLGLISTTLASVVGLAFALGLWKRGVDKDIETMKSELGRVVDRLEVLSEYRCRCGDLYKRWPPDAQK